MTTGDQEAGNTADDAAPAAEALEKKGLADDKNPPYVIGLGGSAGGIEALQVFFEHTPATTGLVMARSSMLPFPPP